MDKSQFAKQLEAILTEFNGLAAKSAHNDLSDLPDYEPQALVTKAVAAVNRIAGASSSYGGEIQRVLTRHPPLHLHIAPVIGVIQALLSDIKSGYIDALTEQAHADVFADFLEMAQHLLEAKYKDASAVIAGSSLEAHLRALCAKHSIPTVLQKTGGSLAAKKAESMNSELAGASVYSKLDQKSVTAWLDLRNKAAHGHYGDYQTPQVELMVAGVREFIRRTPA